MMLKEHDAGQYHTLRLCDGVLAQGRRALMDFQLFAWEANSASDL